MRAGINNVHRGFFEGAVAVFGDESLVEDAVAVVEIFRSSRLRRARVVVS